MIDCRLLVAFVAVIGVARGTSPAGDKAPLAEPITLENVVAPAANTADEPLAEVFSAARAVRFIDRAALAWQRDRNCMTCHTNYLYLMARPAVDAANDAHRTVRAFAESLVSERWPSQGPRWDAEVVMTATALAHNDAATTGKLHPRTREALDRIWTVQRDDGGFDWLKCDWPPMESDDHFGATMAAIGVGVAPEDYAETPAAEAGLAKLRAYLAANPPPTLHHKAMVLWASVYVDGLMTPEERTACAEQLLDRQQPDGGWGLATLGDWQRNDGSPQDLTSSDGYGTGFVIYIARLAGVPADDQRIGRGIAWLKQNQRESGRWFTRSLHADSHHFITHAGTSMAILALASCGEL